VGVVTCEIVEGLGLVHPLQQTALGEGRGLREAQGPTGR